MQNNSIKRRSVLKALSEKKIRLEEKEKCFTTEVTEGLSSQKSQDLNKPSSFQSEKLHDAAVQHDSVNENVIFSSESHNEEVPCILEESGEGNCSENDSRIEPNFFNASESSSDDSFSEKRKKCKNSINPHFCLLIRKKLRAWAITFCIVQSIVTALLKILKDTFPCLPSHGKNLTRTKNLFTLSPFCPENPLDRSEFAYIGLSKQLERVINPKNHSEKHLKLQFNIDGLPLFKSGGVELWPILGKVHFQSDL